MVNRKKSPVADNEKKTALKNSKEDECCDENPAKRQRRDSGAKQRLCFTSEPCTKKDGQDLEEPLDGTSGLDNGQEVTLETMADMDAGPDGDGCKENAVNPVPVVSHQIATRSVTGRLTRRLRSYSPPKSPPPVTKKSAVKDGQKAGTSNPPPVSGTPEIKTRKQWEQWSVQDKDMFFEALYEHGKDFEAIQNSISLKLKKKDPTCGVRTKDHIRHFYYRTWHKISKFIDLEGFDDINKQALELYGLINYGELHKWIGKLNEKTGQKLNELVHKGATVVKVKQKNHRVKTPVCRALKRLHHVEEHKEEEKTKMPERVTIELFPHTNSAWAEVQSLAQNPRLRVQLRISKRIGSLVDFINRKWASDRLRMKEKLNETELPQSEIKIHVPDTTKLSPLSVKQAPTAPKLEFSFDSYVESVKGQLNSSPQLIKKPSKSILGKMENIQIQQPSTSQDQTEVGDHVQDNQVSSTDEVSLSADNFSLPSTTVPSPERPKEGSPGSPAKCERFLPVPVCIDHFDESAIPFSDLAEEKAKQDERTADDADSNPCGEMEVNKNNGLSEEELEAMEKLRKLERGLTVSDCGSMTIAEVYMMSGCPKKLCLEYEWVEKKVTEDIWELNKKLTNMLRRLVHLATTEFVEFKKTKSTTVTPLSRSPCRCTCGGTRNDNTPPSNRIISGRSTRVNSPAASRMKSVGRSPSTPTSSINREQLQTGVTKHETLMCNTDPATPPSSKCHLVMTSPESNVQSEEGAGITAADGVFKLPTAMPPRVQQIRPMPPGSLAEKSQLLHQISMVQKQSEFYATKRSGQRRLQRVVRRPLVVQRTLLPKAQAPARQIMTLAMVPGVSPAGQTASFLPIMSSSVLKPGDTVLQTTSPALPSAITSVSGIQAVAVSQDFGVMQTATTTRSAVTTVSSAPVSKPATVRRIIPTPVTAGSEDSAVFVEAPEIGGINNNILKKAALAADIQDPLSPSQGVKKDVSNDLPTLPQGQINFTSGSGNQSIETPSTFSQAFTLNGVNSILSDNSLSSGHVITISESQPSTSLIAEQPNVSELLDITLPSVSDMAECTDKLLDISLMNSNSSFGGLVGDKDASLSSLLNPTDDSGALSPSKVFKGITSVSSEEQWLNTGDISMSNFLQETAMKKNSSSTMTQVATSALSAETKLTSDASNSQPIASHSQPFALGESSRDSVILKNVETTFEVMMNENSMDYMSKFADLAAHINGSHQELSAIRKQAELIRDQTS